MTQTTDEILAERGARYGLFKDHAMITQDLKRAAAAFIETKYGVVNNHLTNDQQEALEMIFHKIGRILNGDPNYSDSWRDIAGYAQLVADRLDGKVR